MINDTNESIQLVGVESQMAEIEAAEEEKRVQLREMKEKHLKEKKERMKKKKKEGKKKNSENGEKKEEDNQKNKKKGEKKEEKPKEDEEEEEENEPSGIEEMMNEGEGEEEEHKSETLNSVVSGILGILLDLMHQHVGWTKGLIIYSSLIYSYTTLYPFIIHILLFSPFLSPFLSSSSSSSSLSLPPFHSQTLPCVFSPIWHRWRHSESISR